MVHNIISAAHVENPLGVKLGIISPESTKCMLYKEVGESIVYPESLQRKLCGYFIYVHLCTLLKSAYECNDILGLYLYYYKSGLKISCFLSFRGPSGLWEPPFEFIWFFSEGAGRQEVW